MNSITLDYSFWVKLGHTFLNLFIGSNGVIFCSETSIVRGDVSFFVQDSPIFFQWSVAALLQYAFVETFHSALIQGLIQSSSSFSAGAR